MTELLKRTKVARSRGRVKEEWGKRCSW